jgi:hypothetical protein
MTIFIGMTSRPAEINPASSSLAASTASARGLYIGEYGAFRIGAELIKVKVVSRHIFSAYSTYAFAISYSVRLSWNI